MWEDLEADLDTSAMKQPKCGCKQNHSVLGGVGVEELDCPVQHFVNVVETVNNNLFTVGANSRSPISNTTILNTAYDV